MNLIRQALIGVFIAANLALTSFFGCTAIVNGKIVPPGFSCEGTTTGQGCAGVPDDEVNDWVCIEGSCEPSSCGDGFVDPRTEECDEAVTGCQSCQWVCTSNDDCDDDEYCNGQETCNLGTHLCVATGSLPPEGGACTTADDEPGTCQSLVCTPPDP